METFAFGLCPHGMRVPKEHCHIRCVCGHRCDQHVYLSGSETVECRGGGDGEDCEEDCTQFEPTNG